MTQQQIDAGKSLANRLTTPPGAVVLAAQFLRLVEEREALLAAAKRAESVGEIRFKTNALASDVHDALAAAIAKAEAP